MKLKESFIVPSYWILFIFIPLMVVGLVVIHFQYPKWILALAIIFIFCCGEHGIRKWTALFTEVTKSKERE
ncbi:MAG: hypothetical protein B0W54_01395 [Cellvibrio sp. 79]|nr:MAG: hypothetical protein B0W54_01395 [Cellvibrio sp. 79]